MRNATIDGHITTYEALKRILKLHIIIAVNTWRCLDRFVHRFPWCCIVAIVAISTLICLVQIGKARAERDYYNHKNVKLTEKVASYEAAFGAN